MAQTQIDSAKLRELIRETDEATAKMRRLLDEDDGSTSAPNVSRSLAAGQAQGLLRALRKPQESPRPWDDACDSALQDTINRLLRRGIDGETISRSLYRLSQSY